MAPIGTVAVMLAGLQYVMLARVPLKRTELAPWVGPKSVPFMATGVLTAPDVGDIPVICGIAAFGS